MITRFRAIALAILVVSLFGASAGTASADEVDDLYAGANAVTASLSVLGTPVGSFAGTSAVAEQTPLVDVGSFGFLGPDGTPGISVSAAKVDTLGDAVRDPGGDGMRCDVPDLAGLPIADILSIVDVCSASEAALASLTTPTALGAANAGGVALNGTALADVIFDLLLDPILADLGGVVAPVQEALAPLEDALASLCASLPAELSPRGLAETANSAGLPVTDVIRALPDGEEILDALEADCLLSLDTLVDLVSAVPAIAEGLVRDTLLAALDRDLLSVTLGSSASTIGTQDDVLAATSRLQALEIRTLSLQFLLDAIESLVADHVQGVLDQVVAEVPAELGAVLDQVPALGDVLGQVLGQLELTGLIDDAPLLQISVGNSLADARSVAGGSDVDISRSTAGGVVAKISPAIAGLLGIPSEVAVAPGESVTLAAGTPLESKLSVGSVEPITEVLGASKVQTAGARVSTTEVALLTGLDGGIVASTGVTEARLGGTLAASPAAPPRGDLPRTGSSDQQTLLLGMAALALFGATLGLRRRLSPQA